MMPWYPHHDSDQRQLYGNRNEERYVPIYAFIAFNLAFTTVLDTMLAKCLQNCVVAIYDCIDSDHGFDYNGCDKH